MVEHCWALNQMWEDATTHKPLCCLPVVHPSSLMLCALQPWSIGQAVCLSPPQGYRSRGFVHNFTRILTHHEISHFVGGHELFFALYDQLSEEERIPSMQFFINTEAYLADQQAHFIEDELAVPILQSLSIPELPTAPAYLFREEFRAFHSLPYYQIQEEDNLPSTTISIEHADGSVYADVFHVKKKREEILYWDSYLAAIKHQDGIIFPQEIEYTMALMEVEQVIATGSPDLQMREVPAIFVKVKPDAPLGGKELYEFAQRKMRNPAHIPLAFHIVDEFPLLASGDVDRLSLYKSEIKRIIIRESQKLGVDIGHDVSVYFDKNKEHDQSIEVVIPTLIDEADKDQLLTAFEKLPYQLRFFDGRA